VLPRGKLDAMAFEDRFSGVAADYAAHRPEWPPDLADLLAARAPARAFAWEVGCGSGQLSVLLGDRFARVLASDASARQVASARLHPGVEYRVGRAEDPSGLPDHSADLCVAAQAAHWLDLDPYYAEVRRVGRPGALIALLAYGNPLVDADVAAPLEALIAAVRPHWPANRAAVDRLYADLPFPFPEEPLPPLALTVRWTAERYVGYATTWSATQAFVRARGAEALVPLYQALRRAWGAGFRTVRWPIGGRVGRV
jgi:SAM-dependent methyltransferase